MGFYYFNVLSLIPLAVAYGILGLVLYGIARASNGKRWRKAVLLVLGMCFAVLPIAEELWIAWNFGQACKTAGTFIYKKVEVEGFYDETMASGFENVKRLGYKFVEHQDVTHQKIERVELADATARDRALAWYSEKNPGKERPKDTSIIFSINDREQIAVFPTGTESWRITKLDRPTARYHFKMSSGDSVAHKISIQDSSVVDSLNSEVVARYSRYSREAPWYFIGFGRTPFGCDRPNGWPNSNGSFLIYRDVLRPISTH